MVPHTADPDSSAIGTGFIKCSEFRSFVNKYCSGAMKTNETQATEGAGHGLSYLP